MSHEDTRSAVQGLWNEHTASVFPLRLRGREVGGVEMVLLDALAPGGLLASFSDSRKVFLDGQPIAYEVVELVAEAVSKDRVVDGLAAPFYLRDWVMLESRLPVVPLVSARCEVTRTAQLLGTEALGHPALHLRDVTKLCSFDEAALDAQAPEFPGHFRTSRRVERWSCHTERLSAVKRK
jgi:hypothetical protein